MLSPLILMNCIKDDAGYNLVGYKSGSIIDKETDWGDKYRVSEDCDAKSNYVEISNHHANLAFTKILAKESTN